MSQPGASVTPVPEAALKSIDGQIEAAGGEWREPEEYAGSVGRTMFDSPSSDDGSVTTLMASPNIEAFILSAEETAEVLGTRGDIRLGRLEGNDAIDVGIVSDSKAVLPRHLGVLGTTGGGKSTTISGLVAQAQQAGIATVLLDTEGEYTAINEPTSDPNMIRALERRGMHAAGVPDTHVYHLAGRES